MDAIKEQFSYDDMNFALGKGVEIMAWILALKLIDYAFKMMNFAFKRGVHVCLLFYRVIPHGLLAGRAE